MRLLTARSLLTVSNKLTFFEPMVLLFQFFVSYQYACPSFPTWLRGNRKDCYVSEKRWKIDMEDSSLKTILIIVFWMNRIFLFQEILLYMCFLHLLISLLGCRNTWPWASIGPTFTRKRWINIHILLQLSFANLSPVRWKK